MLISSSPFFMSRSRPRDWNAGISEKCRWIHLYSARRISWDYLRIAGLDERDFVEDLSRVSSIDLFLQMLEDGRDFCIFPTHCQSSSGFKGILIIFKVSFWFCVPSDYCKVIVTVNDVISQFKRYNQGIFILLYEKLTANFLITDFRDNNY